jgi:glucose-6-phosphate isomerase
MTVENWLDKIEKMPGGDDLQRALESLKENDIMPRVWLYDHTVWGSNVDEVSNRLGWLHTAEVMKVHIPRLQRFVEGVRADGMTQVLLLGMGGSSLAPEVFSKTFGVAAGYLDLNVLDSTDPGSVKRYSDELDLSRTLFIVSTKSGGTVETLSFFKYFYNHVMSIVGEEKVARHFAAITDPGSSLADLAREYRFRETFLNDPNIGGRYSALSYFGLTAAALVGVDLQLLLSRATEMAASCGPQIFLKENPAAVLGAILGVLALAGRDKVTFVLPDSAASFGDWVEQLIAESTGKEGRGVLPVVGEPLAAPQGYVGNDRLFVVMQVGDDVPQAAQVQALEDAGQPVLRIQLADAYDLGPQFFLWELATAVAGHVLKINPFDQPDVEAAKVQARSLVSAYAATGRLEIPSPRMDDGQMAAYVPEQVTVRGRFECPGDVLKAFVLQAKPGDYLSLQAYLEPSQKMDAALDLLRRRLRDRLGLATTVGYGPRFLHSTGQLHKGDAGNGLFVQLTSDSGPDVPIPDRAGSEETTISFGVLKMAQALGDQQALLDAGRRVIRLHMKKPLLDLEYLADCV